MPTMLRYPLLLALGLCAFSASPRAFAQTAATTTLGEKSRHQMEAIVQARNARTPAQKKINSQLFYARQIALTGTTVAGAPKLRSNVTPEADGRYKVRITASVTPELLAFITTQGGDVLDSFPAYRAVYALLPLASLETVAAREEVQFINQFVPPMHGQQARAVPATPDFAQQWATEALAMLPEVDTAVNDPEGDATHAAKAARAQYGVSGTGVKVGVLSDSIDNGQGAYQAALDAGYVPAINVVPGQGGTSSGEGEGLAMCEIVHRLAPGATIYFASGDASAEQFAENIAAMVADGCKIILDDIAYPGEFPFQDAGPIAQAVDAASAKGVLYFSCAANFNNLDNNSGYSACWEGDYVSRDGSGTGYHAWDSAGDGLNEAQDQSGTLAVTLFWAEPADKATSQYDLVELDQYGDVYQVADDSVSSTGTPGQLLTNFPTGRYVGVYLESGSARFLHVDIVAQHAWMIYSTAGRVRGHNCANSANAFCVAATPAATGTSDGDGGRPGPNGPYPNVFTSSDQVEPFSDDGPRRVFFENDGTPYTPGNYTHTGGKVLNKPDFTAADGVTTSLPSGGGLNPFFGTSAATPHAGALAALLLSFAPELTPAQVGTALRSGCVEIANPGPGDRDAGKGILLAPNILAAAAKIIPPEITSVDTATAQTGKAFSYQITATGSPTSYGVGGLPGGITVNAKTGLISGTPVGPGTHSLTLRAANAAGTGTKTLTLTIEPAVPVISSTGTASATVGKVFLYTITASHDPTRYGVKGLPGWLKLNAQTGVLSGTPTAKGTYDVTLQAANSGGTGTKTLAVTVAAE